MNTEKRISEMNITEIQTAIAQAVSWSAIHMEVDRNPDSGRMSYLAGRHPDSEANLGEQSTWWRFTSPVPNFPSSLDAMYEAEKSLTHEQCVSYYAKLQEIQAYEVETIHSDNGQLDYPAYEFWFHASASQRAHAFLLTIGYQE